MAALLLRSEEPRGFARADLLAGHSLPVCCAGYYPGSGKLVTIDTGGNVKTWPGEPGTRNGLGWVAPLREWRLPQTLPSLAPSQPAEASSGGRGRPEEQPLQQGGVAGLVPWLTFFRKKAADGVDVIRREVVFRELDSDPNELSNAFQRSYEVTTGKLLASTR